MRYLIENLKGPIVIVCLARPEFLARHEGWRDIGGARHELLELSAVNAHESSEIMAARSVSVRAAPAPRLIEAGVGMAGGTPGLLEHMVRIFFDAGVLREQGSTWEVDLDRLAARNCRSRWPTPSPRASPRFRLEIGGSWSRRPRWAACFGWAA